MFEPDSIRNLAIFVLIVGGLIFLHELGHFVAAIRLGVKVKEFGLGFPPRAAGITRDREGNFRLIWGSAVLHLFGFFKGLLWLTTRFATTLVRTFHLRSAVNEAYSAYRNEQRRISEAIKQQSVDTESVIYSLNWIPLGGFVKPAGEDDPSVPDGLSASPKLTRFIVLAAGPAMNLLVGVIVFTVAFMSGYPQYTDRILIAAVVSGAPADLAGVKPGDVVTSANNQAINSTEALKNITHSNLGRPIALALERGTERLEIAVTPRTEWPEGEGPMGVALDYEWTLVTQPLPQAFISGVAQVGVQIRETFMMPVRVVTGQIKPSEARVVSIIGIKQINDVVVETAVEAQSLFPIFQFTGMITVALAIANLLPLPALDGGRILFVLIEAARGRRVDPLREGYVHIMGMLVLLALMGLLILNDILNPIVVPR